MRISTGGNIGLLKALINQISSKNDSQGPRKLA